MPKTYEVEIVASISKRIEVVADSEEHAQELAHEMFHLEYDGTPEVFEQDTYRIEEIGEQ